METFPLNPYYSVSEEIAFDVLISNTGELGKEQRRLKSDSSRSAWKWEMKNVVKTAANQAWDFFKARKGSFEAFYFIYEGETHTVRFGTNKMSREQFEYQLYNGGIAIVEVTS